MARLPQHFRVDHTRTLLLPVFMSRRREAEQEDRGLRPDPHLAPNILRAPFFWLLFISARMTKAGGEFRSSASCVI